MPWNVWMESPKPGKSDVLEKSSILIIRYLISRTQICRPKAAVYFGTPGLEPAARFYGSRFLPSGKMFQIPSQAVTPGRDGGGAAGCLPLASSIY